MTLGQWLGKWAGQWQGSGVEQPPGHMSGFATLRITASGTIDQPATQNLSGLAFFGFSASGTLSYEGTEETIQITGYTGAVGGGGGAGTSYVKKDHGWVRLTKVVRTGGRTYPVKTFQRRDTHVEKSNTYALAYGATRKQTTNLRGGVVLARTVSYLSSIQAKTQKHLNADHYLPPTRTMPGHIEWISADELIGLILEISTLAP